MSANSVASEFEALMGALWGRLGLGAPPRGGRPAQLSIDGHRVALELTRDERSVLVSTDLGPLAVERGRSEDQLRRLLRGGAGHVLGRASGVRITDDDDGPGRALVEAVCACRRGGVSALERALEDVLALADQLRPVVSGAASPSPSAAAMPSDDHLIFRL